VTVSAYTLATCLQAIEDALAMLPMSVAQRTNLILAKSELRSALETLKIQIKEESNGR
jgi:hypothetical protein